MPRRTRLCAVLEGGPFHGICGSWCDIPELPARCWVYICNHCGEVKWDYEWVEGAEVYTFDRMGPEGVGVYVYADVAPSLRTKIPEVAAA